MIGLDTNVVVRYLVQDDPVQSAALIAGLLTAAELRLDRADVARAALDRRRDGVDFADAVIVELGRAAGCEHTVTFDQRAARSAGMRLLRA